MTILRALEGLILRFVAELIGAPVNSWHRSAEHNAAVGGKANSAHLHGGAIDTPVNLTDWQRWILRRVALEIPEPEKNHLHYQVDGRVWLLAARVARECLALARRERPSWGMVAPPSSDERPS